MSKISDKPPKQRRITEKINRISEYSFIKKIALIDDKLFLKFFNDTKPNPIFKKIMYFFSRLGDGYIWLVIAAICFILKLPYIYMYLIRGLAASILCIIFFAYSKSVINRTRPYEKHGKTPMMNPPDRYSFPSGHTIVAFAISATLGTYNPPLAIIYYGISIMIAASRIYVGVHYPLDVLASVLIGTIIGFSINIIFYLLIGFPIIGNLL